MQSTTRGPLKRGTLARVRPGRFSMHLRRAVPGVIILAALCMLVVQLNPASALASRAYSSVINRSPTLANELSSLAPVVTAPVRSACLGGTPSSNLIVAENSCPGTSSWRVNLPIGPANAIEGFTNEASVNLGQSIQLYVSNTAASYTFQLYRMGWYQGYGARLMYTSPPIPGINQPPPLVDFVTGMVSCTNWSHPVTLHIPASWVSGVYLVKLVSSAGFIRYTLFVVRDDTSTAPLLIQLPFMTYEAYNPWGGRSLYAYDSDDQNPSPKVSFDRPFASDYGLGQFPAGAYNLVRWLERNGYNASYMADVDVVLHPQPLTRHRLIVVAGHDEYWTTQMRQQLAAARDAGVSLAFFSANDVYWHARLEASSLGPDRVIVCYRRALLDPMTPYSPSETTVEWRQPPVSQPENGLLGAMFAGIAQAPAALVLRAGALPFLGGTHLRAGSTFPGLVAGEVDTYFSNSQTPKGVTILAASPVRCLGDWCHNGRVMSDTTLYTAPSGAHVFNAGSFYLARGLDDDNALALQVTVSHTNADFQQFIRNLFAYLLGD
jgi:hypothetical protein